MPKIFFIADLHLGSGVTIPDSLARQQDALDELSDIITKESPELIIIGGDIFEFGDPDQIVKDMFLSFMSKLDTQDIRIIPGNHDYQSKSQGYHAAKTLEILNKEFKHVSVYSSYKLEKILGVNILFIPARECTDQHLKVIGKNLPDDVKVDILVGHAPIVGSTYRSFSMTRGLSTEVLLDFKPELILMGDIHDRQQFYSTADCQGWYSGALYQTNFGESVELCGFLEVRLDGNKKWQVLSRTLSKPKILARCPTIEDLPINAIIEFRSNDPLLDEDYLNKLAAKQGSIIKTIIREAVKKEATRIKGMSLSSTPTEDLKLYFESTGEIDTGLREEALGILEDALNEN